MQIPVELKLVLATVIQKPTVRVFIPYLAVVCANYAVEDGGLVIPTGTQGLAAAGTADVNRTKSRQ